MSDTPSSGVEELRSADGKGAGRWMLVSRIAAQLSQISLFLIAVRFLTPAEFGLFALVQAASALLFVVAAAGWREAIISTAETQRDLAQLMAFSLISGAAMAMTGTLAAFALHLMHLTAAAQLALLFTICVLIAPVVSAFNGMMVRRGRIRAFVIVSILAEALAFAAASASLLAGFGIYALVVGKIVFLVVVMCLLAPQSGWRGRLALTGPRTRALLSTSLHILANRTIFFIQTNSSTFLVGAFLGPVGVGFYRAAERVVSSVAELVMEPLRIIAWIDLRRAADKGGVGIAQRQRLTEAAASILPLFICMTAPVFIGLAIVAQPLVEFALGPAWSASGGVATIFALAALSVVPGVLTEPLLSLLGEIRHLPRIILMNAAFSAVCMVILGPFGLYALAAAAIPSGLFTLATTFWILQRHGGFAWRPALRRAGIAIPPLCAMGAAVFGIQWLAGPFNLPLIAQLALQVGAGAIAYLGLLHALRPGILLAIRRF